MNLHIELDETHPAYEWLNQQADKLGARGHFGTHIDCYTKTPAKSFYEVDVILLDCRNGMPSDEDLRKLPSLENKALLLFTGNMSDNDYGTKAYFGKRNALLTKSSLEVILTKSPSFILIDSFGIGTHGENHQMLDKRCEEVDCFVIENIIVQPQTADSIKRISIDFDLDHPSTGKPCEVYAIN